MRYLKNMATECLEFGYNFLSVDAMTHLLLSRVDKGGDTTDGPLSLTFDMEMLPRVVNEHDFLKRIIVSDEETFHVFNKVNKHSCRIWGSGNPHAVQEVERNSPKVNVCCALKEYTWKCTDFLLKTFCVLLCIFTFLSGFLSFF